MLPLNRYRINMLVYDQWAFIQPALKFRGQKTWERHTLLCCDFNRKGFGSSIHGTETKASSSSRSCYI